MVILMEMQFIFLNQAVVEQQELKLLTHLIQLLMNQTCNILAGYIVMDLNIVQKTIHYYMKLLKTSMVDLVDLILQKILDLLLVSHSMFLTIKLEKQLVLVVVSVVVDLLYQVMLSLLLVQQVVDGIFQKHNKKHYLILEILLLVDIQMYKNLLVELQKVRSHCKQDLYKRNLFPLYLSMIMLFLHLQHHRQEHLRELDLLLIHVQLVIKIVQDRLTSFYQMKEYHCFTVMVLQIILLLIQLYHHLVMWVILVKQQRKL